MLKVISSRPNVAFLALTNLLCLVVCADWSQAAPIKGSVQLVSDKLEAYALGKVSSSGLSIAELKDAFEEVQSWDQSEFLRKKESEPTFSLLVDFLFVPMSKVTDPTRDGVSQERGSTARRDYITRLEKHYKVFRPAYFDQSIKSIGLLEYVAFTKLSPKTDQLIASLTNARGSKPLTRKMFDQALIEYNMLMQRAEEIKAHEDIYGCLTELKIIYNYKNRAEVKTLRQALFPLLKTQDSIDDMKELYKSELINRAVA